MYPATESESADMTHTRILIIDDEPGVIEGLTCFLEDEGYEVHEALEAAKGLDLFRSVGPDMVLTDLRMPGMSGMELINEIRSVDENTPIIVITGFGTFESAIDAIRLNVFDFITKPINLDSLKETLNRARSMVIRAIEVEREVMALRNNLEGLDRRWRQQLSNFSEVEPLIQTGRMLAGVLHDMSGPLMYIMNQAEMLRMLHPELKAIESIQQQADKMSRIMTALARRVQNAKFRETCVLQLNQILKDEVSFLDSQVDKKREIQKEWLLAEDLPLFEGIAIEFSQIFGNILRNAVEAMRDQPTPRLRICSWYDESNIFISINDNGPGISIEQQEKIFDAFFSTKAPMERAAGAMGLGIGLYNCRELLRQYGGQIEVLSKPGLGAAFVITLPRRSRPTLH